MRRESTTHLMTRLAVVRFSPTPPHLMLIRITLGPPVLRNATSAASRVSLRIFPSYRKFRIPHRANIVSNRSNIDVPVFRPHPFVILLRGDKVRVIHWEYTIVLSPAFSAIWSCSIIASIFALGSRSSSPRRQVAIVCWLGFLTSAPDCLPFWSDDEATLRFSNFGSLLSSSVVTGVSKVRGFSCGEHRVQDYTLGTSRAKPTNAETSTLDFTTSLLVSPRACIRGKRLEHTFFL